LSKASLKIPGMVEKRKAVRRTECYGCPFCSGVVLATWRSFSLHPKGHKVQQRKWIYISKTGRNN